MGIFAGLLALIAGGTENKKVVTVRMIDESGDMRATTIPIDSGATQSEISDYVSALSSLTQSIIWSVEVNEIFGVIPSNGGATDDAHSSVFDNVVLNFKDSTGDGTSFFIPAPVNTLVLEGDVVDTSLAGLTTLVSAIQTVSNIGTPVSARFTERREINTKVPM